MGLKLRSTILQQSIPVSSYRRVNKLISNPRFAIDKLRLGVVLAV